MFNQTIAQLETEIFGLQLQLKETELSLSKAKLEYSNLLINIAGESVCSLAVEEELFWDKWNPEDYWLTLEVMENRYPKLWEYRQLVIALKNLPQDCLSLYLMIDDKKQELKKLKEKNNVLTQLIQLASTLF